MSSSDRRQFLTCLAALPLAACGYTPAYAPGGPALALRGRIEADAPTSRDAFFFVARFEDRLGRADAPTLRLAYRISTQRVDIAVTTTGAILRYNLLGTVTWTLTDIKTRTRLAGGTETNFTGSAATTATIPAQAAEDDARRRLMVILADQVVTRLIAAAPALPAPAKG